MKHQLDDLDNNLIDDCETSIHTQSDYSTTNTMQKNKDKLHKENQEKYIKLYKQRELVQQQYNIFDKQIMELEKKIKLFQEQFTIITNKTTQLNKAMSSTM